MKLTNGEIFIAQEPLKKLMEERLPIKVSYELAKLAQKLTEQLSIIQTVREGLFKTYGILTANGRGYDVLEYLTKKDEADKDVIERNPNWEKFRAGHSELMAQEVEIVYDKVTLPETLEIEPSVLLKLDKFINIK